MTASASISTSTSTVRRFAGTAVAAVLVAVLSSAGHAQTSGAEARRPVSAARDGHTLEESLRHRAGYAFDRILVPEGFGTGDANVYYYLHWEDVRPVNIVRRAGPVLALPSRPDPRIGRIRADTPMGSISLDELAVDERSRLQGFIVVHRGRIVHEIYPGMRPDDNHIWFSVSKTLPATVLTIMEAQGKLSFGDPVERHLPEMRGTAWEGIAVRDILDMASGLDIEETPGRMGNPDHTVHRFFRTALGGEVRGADGKPLTVDELIRSAEDVEGTPAGAIFEYSSLNTRVLTMLAERIGGRRFAELLGEYVWQVIGAEADGFLGLSPSGAAQAGGMMNSRLRDLARYGLLFTPSGERAYGAAARQRWGVEALSLAERVNACRPALYRAAREGAEGFFGPDDPEVRCNSLQWDFVYADGDMFKAGVGGQGLYVSPGRDLVVAFFSTSHDDWERFARAIAKATPALP